MADPPPPPPPPHGQDARPAGGTASGSGSGLPDGNYDIFIIPPHSAGSGFLYLPSMQPHRNSFLLGVACTLLAVGVWTLVMPVLKQWLSTVVASGGMGVLLLVAGVGIAGWAWGKTQGEAGSGEGEGGGKGSTNGTGKARYEQRQHESHPHGYAPQPDAQSTAPPPPPRPPEESTPPKPGPTPKSAAASGWEKAREETRKREEERKRSEELKKKREEAQKLREEAERVARAKAEKDKWEQARSREKEQREREARERIARERLARDKETREKEKEAREKDTREREAREKAEKEKTRTPSKPATSKYEKPTATSYVASEAGNTHSYRPYDSPPSKNRPTYKSSASSISGLSESSYAPTVSTARTTPPPSQRGPYSTQDPDKIHLKAVYLFTDSFPTKPVAQLISNTGAVTDGLILRIKTEGLFIDDDIRGVPQREWDVKAWTLKLVEDGKMGGLHVLRATARDAENKRYTFVLEETEAWKVAVGLQKLKKGSQVRSLGMNGMKEGEVKGLLGGMGWL
ncbi:hypothetical protein LTR86_010315 [Recurvomyces mirabilis]|nr:hypothetical protein LTR86_010315 [Recurvomyces mirabilis]